MACFIAAYLNTQPSAQQPSGRIADFPWRQHDGATLVRRVGRDQQAADAIYKTP
jgi:hypothetical protein